MRRSDIPASSGVYRAYIGDECVYVGSSMDLKTRISGHPHRKIVERWAWALIAPEFLEREERMLIDALQPRLNRTSKTGRAKSGRTVLRHMSLDVEVVDAFERFCAAKKERPTAMVQRMMIEAMKRSGYWKNGDKATERDL